MSTMQSNAFSGSTAGSVRSPTIVARGFPVRTCRTSARVTRAAAEPSRVVVATHFEHAASNLDCVTLEKTLDVVAVDRRAAIEPEIATDRCHRSEVAER